MASGRETGPGIGAADGAASDGTVGAGAVNFVGAGTGVCTADDETAAAGAGIDTGLCTGGGCVMGDEAASAKAVPVSADVGGAPPTTPPDVV